MFVCPVVTFKMLIQISFDVTEAHSKMWNVLTLDTLLGEVRGRVRSD